MMYEGVRALGRTAVNHVRETPEWKRYAAELETEARHVFRRHRLI
jgi:hypothetical protein